VAVKVRRKKGIDGIQEMFQNGVLGLLTAIDKFDLGRGTKFSTYANYWIFQSMQRESEYHDFETAARIPCYLVVSFRQGKCTEEERQRVELLSMTTKIDEVSPDDHYNALGFTPEHPLEVMCYNEEIESLEEALRWLSTHFKEAFDVLLSRMDGETLDEIGERLGVCRERVRQIETIAIDRLCQYYGVPTKTERDSKTKKKLKLKQSRNTVCRTKRNPVCPKQ
jgi:RNA polymerase sigma factor (sigma-70 family)